MMPSAGHGRGRYDRSATASERAQRARQSLLIALRDTLLELGEECSLDTVVARAGLGRNTFYSHFRDLASARAEVVADSMQTLRTQMDAALSHEETPYAAVGNLAQSWVHIALTHPVAVRIAVQGDRAKITDLLSSGLLAVHRAGAQAGVFRRELLPERLLGLAALGVELLAAVAAERARSEAASATLSDAILALSR